MSEEGVHNRPADLLAASLARFTAVSRIAMSTAMIPMTTNSSTKVNPTPPRADLGAILRRSPWATAATSSSICTFGPSWMQATASHFGGLRAQA